ncbi:hypothetical protein [Myroides sp.]|uniref:hypothetical protein n=1 Tax=Myroides sp. TaxID=1874736 RepID=UPI003F3A8112
MKKKLLLASTVFMALSTTYAQEGVGIGKSILPDATAVLDVGATNKGILIPRVTLTGEGDNSTITGGAYPESLLVYHLGGDKNPLTKGFYFWLDGKWNALVSKTSTTTSEVLTKLTVKEDATSKEIVLSYIDEHNTNNTVEVSTALQNNDAFKKFISDLVTSTAGGTIVKAGTGITVKPESNNDPVNPVMTYTISADPVGITLAGDVTGKGTETVVEKINGVNVAKPADTDNGLALVYIGGEWKPGKPKIDNTSVTDKADLTVDSSLEFTTGTGTGALLSAAGLKVKAGGITNTHLAADAVKEGNIENSAVTETKILDGAVTTGKIKGGTKGQVLISGDANATAWGSIQETAVIGGAGVTVTDATAGNVKTYTVTTNPTTLTLVGDVSGNAGATSVDKIKGVNVVKPADTDNGLALVYDGGEWKAGKPIVEIKDITNKATIESDGIIDIAGATNNKLENAVLLNTKLSIKDASITGGKIQDASVSGTKLTAGTVNIDRIDSEQKQNMVLGTDDTGKLIWSSKSSIATKESLKTDGIIVIGDASSVNKESTETLLKATTLSIREASITGDKIQDASVGGGKLTDATVDIKKLANGTEADLVLTTGAGGVPTWTKKDQIATKKELSTDGVILIGGGTEGGTKLANAVLETTALSIKAGGIADTHLAPDAVTETKIAANAVTEGKILDGAVTLGKLADAPNADYVLKANANKKPEWVAQSTIVPQGVDLTGTDNTIVVTAGTGAVLKAASLKVGDGSIKDTHLATIAAKNQHLVTDGAGKPKWESKAVNITSTATLLNEAIDGKKVYSVTIPAAAVVAPTSNTSLTYNSEMTVPIAADFDYLLSVQVFRGGKLVLSSATDGTAASGKLTFRFGGNGMYLTLPVAADYKVILKYVSNQSYEN